MNTTDSGTSRSSSFQRYSAYYDLLYRDKDYQGEAAFVHDALVRHGGKCGRLLELGCGTGRHAMEFAALGWTVRGYDVSAGMIERARTRAHDSADSVSFEVGDIRNLREPAVFDAVISLFHVMSYQISDEDLRHAIATAASHLPPGGLFFFDFWYGPAVLADPPEKRTKRLANERISIVRHAVPTVDHAARTVRVDYTIEGTDLVAAESFGFTEEHTLRYLFMPELTTLLAQGGFAVAESGRWMERKPADSDSWYVWLVAQKA
jgi:SAM-dependent methyltransferase